MMGIYSIVLGQLSGRQNKKTLAEANDAFENTDYLKAKKYFDKLYLVDSTNNEINCKLGVCNYSLKNYHTLSLVYFTKSSTIEFPEVNYYLGLLYHARKDFEKAILCFNHYKNYKEEKEHTIKEINDLIDKCFTAQLFEASPKSNIFIRNIGSAVNTPYSEYAPLIPADEKFMLFTSRRKNKLHTQTDAAADFYEDIYITTNIDTGWQAPVLLDTIINTPAHDACTGLSANGEKMLIYRTSKDMISGDIYESNLINSKWTIPEILGKNVNADGYSETSACYSADGEIIFFSSDRPGGYGGKDIYYVKKLGNGKWGTPYNLGPTINTEYNEDAPFISPSGTTIYFSSEGHKNMGGYDVFKSNFDESGVFSEPENMGSPINTVGDDIFFVINPAGSTAYMSSEREGGYGSQDIYKVMFTDNVSAFSAYSIYAEDVSKNIIKNIEILLTANGQRETYGVYRSNQLSGKLLVIVKPLQLFHISIQAKGFESLDMDNYSFDKEKEIVLKLNRLKE